MEEKRYHQSAMERIHAASGTRTQVELATLLGIRQSSVSDAKRRNSIPSDWIVTLFRKLGINPDWLETGAGPMYLRTDEGYGAFDDRTSIASEHMTYPHCGAGFQCTMQMGRWCRIARIRHYRTFGVASKSYRRAHPGLQNRQRRSCPAHP